MVQLAWEHPESWDSWHAEQSLMKTEGMAPWSTSSAFQEGNFQLLVFF